MAMVGLKALVLVTLFSSAYSVVGRETSEELDPADVEEAGCPKVTHLKDLDLRHMYGDWELPYLSNHWMRYMAKSMHGKFMKASRMGQSCVRMEVKEMPEGRRAANGNATIWLQSKCPRTGAELNLACVPSPKNAAKWRCSSKDSTDHQGDSWMYVVDTDEMNRWALVVRCFPSNGMNWAILSKGKLLDRKLVKSLLKEVESLGFRLFNVVEIPHEKCKRSP